MYVLLFDKMDRVIGIVWIINFIKWYVYIYFNIRFENRLWEFIFILRVLNILNSLIVKVIVDVYEKFLVGLYFFFFWYFLVYMVKLFYYSVLVFFE